MEIVIDDLHNKRRRTLAEADRLTARAEQLRDMVGDAKIAEEFDNAEK